jgi:hypothetical protein
MTLLYACSPHVPLNSELHLDPNSLKAPKQPIDATILVINALKHLGIVKWMVAKGHESLSEQPPDPAASGA